ncbi:uncharacterized protein [Pseudorasbora parva]|uniref:uncharacterized protein n=1 Tax=Pseudorasbora parva TaxID=51549 RepID=UPI00351F06CA
MTSNEELNVELSEKFLDRCTKEQLLELAESHAIVLTSNDKKRKEDLLRAVKSQLIAKGILGMGDETFGKVLSPRVGRDVMSREKQTQFETERLSFEGTQALKDKEWERRLQLKQLELEQDRERAQVELRKLEYARESEREQRQYEVRKLELELEVKKAEASKSIPVVRPSFDVGRNIKMVPPFCERDVDKYFAHFERVASSLKWPEEVWTLLLQCVLKGKAQEVFASLSDEESADFKQVKTAILRAYELVPEAYRQRFRGYKKLENQTYVEFAREKEIMFTRWCQSKRVETFNQLRELILVEEFKNCVPGSVSTYLNEQRALTLSNAAVLADEFILTHRVSFPDRASSDQGKKSFRNRWTPPVITLGTVPGVPPVSQNVSPDKKGKVVCFYCHKVGLKISECNALKKSVKPVGLVGLEPLGIHVSKQNSRDKKAISTPVEVGDHYTEYAPFITTGIVSLPGREENVSVQILRDTGAAQSFLLEGILPLSGQTATGEDVLIRGIEMTFLKVPLHRVHLASDLVTGDVIVGVRSSLPVPGVAFILGNDLAQGNVWGTFKPVPSTVVVSTPVSAEIPDECGQKFPHVFPSCAVTRARGKQLKADRLCDLSDTPNSEGAHQSSNDSDGTAVLDLSPDTDTSVPELRRTDSVILDRKMLGYATEEFLSSSEFSGDEYIPETEDQSDSDGSAQQERLGKNVKQHKRQKALRNLSEAKWNSPQLLPFAEDVKKTHQYLDRQSKEYQTRLEEESGSKNWAELAKTIHCQVIIFNRRREEVSKMSFTSFTLRDTSSTHPDVELALSDLEKKLCKHFQRIEIRGKRGRKFPILLTPDMLSL